MNAVMTSGSSSEPGKGHSEFFIDGCSLTYDERVTAGYLHMRPNPDVYVVAKTIHAYKDVIVDLDEDGYVRGVETLNGPVDISALLRVLRCCKWAPVSA